MVFRKNMLRIFFMFLKWLIVDMKLVKGKFLLRLFQLSRIFIRYRLTILLVERIKITPNWYNHILLLFCHFVN